MRVLIADDSPIILERLVERLSEIEGLEIVGCARDGLEARELSQKFKPDVLILDLQMPRGTGIDVMNEIWQEAPSPCVILLTNFSYPELKQRCLQAGADYFFDKSHEFEKVLQVIHELMDHPPPSP